MQKHGLHKYLFLIVPLFFLIYASPSALDYVFHYPDEKYYTDAVLQMMDKDDVFTPYQANGAPRFKKPIITYWVLMASYKIFGVSKFSSRLFFWLAGALLVLVTYLMAKSISKNKQIAIIAAFLTASNPLVLMSASRSIPDILLVLFLTISAWGFMEILISSHPQKKFFWMAYVGAALAFETKGIPAAGFAGISILFLLLNPWQKKKIKQLIDSPSILTAIVVALSWFVIMYIQHGSAYLESFFADQVGDRVSSKFIQVITNTFLGIINMIAFLFPWIFIAFSKPKKLKEFNKTLTPETKAVFGFIASWIILFIIMAGAVFRFYDRYVLPVIPIISMGFAYIFIHVETGFKKVSFRIFLFLNITIVLVNIVYAAFILPDIILILGTLFSLGLITSWYIGTFSNLRAEIIIANSIMLLFFNIFILLYPLLMPNPGEQLVENLQKQGVSSQNKVYVYGNIRAASNIRIHSKNSFQVVSMDTVYTLPNEPHHLLVFSKKEQPFLNLDEYTVSMGSEEWSRVPAKKFPKFLRKTILEIKENSTHYYIAKPKSIYK